MNYQIINNVFNFMTDKNKAWTTSDVVPDELAFH